jgi:C4-dicarboxylate-binding protein DctP
MKKWLYLTIGLVCILSLVVIGCAKPAPPTGPAAPPAKPEEPAKPPVEIVLAHGRDSTHPIYKYSEKFKELCEKYGGGRIEVKIFPNNQLYNDETVLPALSAGSVQAGWSYDMAASGWLSTWDITTIPYLIMDWDHMLRFLSTDAIKKALLEPMDAKETHVYCWGNVGGLYFFANDPIPTLDDFKGIKFRAPKSEVQIGVIEAAGGYGVQISASEVYTALQTGMVKGVVTTNVANRNYKWAEMTKYAVTSPFSYMTAFLVFETKWYNSLPSDVRSILDNEVHPELEKYCSDFMKTYDAETWKALRDEFGQHQREFTAQEIQELKSRMAPLYEKYEAKLGKELFDAAQATK